jgi:hypothetical protein
MRSPTNRYFLKRQFVSPSRKATKVSILGSVFNNVTHFMVVDMVTFCKLPIGIKSGFGGGRDCVVFVIFI